MLRRHYNYCFYFMMCRCAPVGYALLFVYSIFSSLVYYFFYQYYKKHAALLDIYDRATGLTLDPFFKAGDLIEKDYQNIITKLHEGRPQLGRL